MKIDELKNVPNAGELMNAAGNPPFLKDYDKLKYNAASKMPVPKPNMLERQKMNENNRR